MLTFRMTDSDPRESIVKSVLECIRRGGVALIPTETQYGLCANALDQEVMRKLMAIKHITDDFRTAIFVSGARSALSLMKNLPDFISDFLAELWPGPMTLVGQARRALWPGVVTEQGTIGLRCSSHALVVDLVRSSDVYLTATSANIHGEEPRADEGYLGNWLSKDVDVAVFDDSVQEDAAASTVVDIAGGFPDVVRPGRISPDRVVAAWSKAVGIG